MKKIIILYIYILVLLVTAYSKEYLSEDSDYLDVYFEKIESGGYKFYGDNRHFIPMFINLGFTSLSNLSIDRENPSKVVLKPGVEKVLIATLVPINKNKSYSFRSRLSYANGDPVNVKPDDFNYMFPFAHGTKFKLDQGFGGKFSHQKENYYALDFSMDIGTPIYAARDGVVIDVKEDSNRGGASAAYANYGNYISIYHSDGTTASYVHLKKDGSIVKVGDLVKQGDHIGFSGNTGLSTGPHLHFSVNVPSETGSRQSIPIKMLGLNGKGVEPVVGQYYYGFNPKKEKFNAVYGKDLTNEDYNNYKQSIKKTNKLEFRDESVDSTTVLYCRNGYDKVVEGTFTFKLNNSLTSKTAPISMEIPPLTEVFICLVKPKDSKKAFSFSYSISYRVIE